MKLSEYKAWLVRHMELKILASKAIVGFNPRYATNHEGFSEALKVMIAFVKEVDPKTFPIKQKEGSP